MKKLLLATATLALAASAFAQTPAAPAAPAAGSTPAATTPQKGSAIKKMDANGDHLISRDEAKSRPHLAKNFDAIDTNKDGQLSKDEIKAFHAARKAAKPAAAAPAPKS